MTSAAEKYGKIPESLSSQARQQVIESGQALQKNEVVQSAGLGTPTRPEATPPKQSQNDEPPQRGLSR